MLKAYGLRKEYALGSRTGFYYAQITQWEEWCHENKGGHIRAGGGGASAGDFHVSRDVRAAACPVPSGQQLVRFHPGREDKVRNLLAYLQRQGRTALAETGGYFPQGEHTRAADAGLIRSVWVLLDFIDRVEFHSPSDFPVKLLFFSAGSMYEVVYVAAGQETLIAQALRQYRQGESRRIVLVEDVGQIPLLDFPDISGFCTVEPDGKVSYYKKTGGM